MSGSARKSVSPRKDSELSSEPAPGRPTLAILVPDGVGVRNFLLGPFLPRLQHSFEPLVLHRFSPEHYSGHWSELDSGRNLNALAHSESPLSALLRYSLAYAHMYRWDTLAMRFLRNMPVEGSWRRKSLHTAAKAVGRIAAFDRAIAALGRLHGRSAERDSNFERFRELLQLFSPAALFCTHQRPPIVIPAVLAAKSLNIPTITFIFSWDNLTSKGRIAAPFDHFFVWSDRMRSELLRFYPDVDRHQVHIVGTPQFDPYGLDSFTSSRDEFCRLIGADPHRPLLCYSGGDSMVCPRGPDQVEALMILIRTGRIRGNPQVVLRPAPTDDWTRYNGLRRVYPELIFARPAWHARSGRDWAEAVPQSPDLSFLANLVRHSAVNVNVSSTMTLDFAIMDKPVVNLAFDIGAPPFDGLSTWEFHYQMDHYRPIMELGAARIAHSPDELAQHVNAYLDDPALDREARRRLVELQVGVPVGSACDRVVRALMNVCRQHQSGALPAPARVPAALTAHR